MTPGSLAVLGQWVGEEDSGGWRVLPAPAPGERLSLPQETPEHGEDGDDDDEDAEDDGHDVAGGELTVLVIDDVWNSLNIHLKCSAKNRRRIVNITNKLRYLPASGRREARPW